MCDLVDLIEDSRAVRIHELPALKFDDEFSFLKAETLLKEYLANMSRTKKPELSKPLEYMRCTKTEDGFYYLVLKTNKP